MKRRLGYNRRSDNKSGMILAVSVVLLILISIFVKGLKLSQTLDTYNERKQELTQELSDEQKRTKEIKEYGKYTQTDEYIEKVARDKLGLVKDNEIVFRNDSDK